MPTRDPKPLRRSPGHQRREQAISVVLQLAAADSPDRITTARISEAMGLSTGALFRHFPDKDALWEAVLLRATSRLDAAFARCESGGDSPLLVLQEIFNAHLNFIIEHPGAPRLLFSELQRPDDTAAKRVVREFLGRHADRIRSHLDDGRTSGEIRPDLDSQAAATLFIGCIQGLVMQSLLNGDPGHLSRTAPGIFDLFRHSIIEQP